MRLKLIHRLDPERKWPITKVVNAETGEPIEGVFAVSFSRTSPDDVGQLTVTVNEPDVEVETEVGEEVMRDPGETKVLAVTSQQLEPVSVSDRTEILVDQMPEGFPPLMIVAEQRLSAESCDRIRRHIATALRDRKPLVIDGGLVAVLQFVDGRWQPVDGSSADPVGAGEMEMLDVMKEQLDVFKDICRSLDKIVYDSR